MPEWAAVGGSPGKMLGRPAAICPEVGFSATFGLCNRLYGLVVGRNPDVPMPPRKPDSGTLDCRLDPVGRTDYERD